MALKDHEECERVKIISKSFINVIHSARSTVLVNHAIPKINWASFQGQFGDHFRSGDHFGVEEEISH